MIALPLQHGPLLTIGFYFYPRIENRKKVLSRLLRKKQVLLVYDSIGDDEEFDRLRPTYYPLGHVFFLCFSISEPVSFESIEKWYHVTTSYANMIDSTWVLLGLHGDERKSEHKFSKESDGGRNFVSRKEAEQLAKDLGRWSKSIVPYVECDARDKGGLQAVVEAVIYP